MKVQEDELKEALRRSPDEVKVGSGFDQTTIQSRKPEDNRTPKWCAPLSIAVSEQVWIPLMQGIAQEKEVDLFQGGSFVTVFGREVRSGTPYETLAGRVNAEYHREAIWRAGRPGLGAPGIPTSVTFFGQAGGFGIPGGLDASTNLATALSPAELKTNYISLNKVVHAISCGAKIYAGTVSFIGGFAGSVEATLVVNIAGALTNIFVHQGSVIGGAIMDARYAGDCGREGVWAHSIRNQALSRASHLLTSDITNQTAGPCTEMLLYESLVGLTTMASGGVSMSKGPRSANGKLTDYLTPLECRFGGEVLHRTGNMKPSDVNEIVKKLIPRYEAYLRNAPKGKSFMECYNMTALRPSGEWLNIYKKVKREAIDLGIPLPN